MYTTCIHYMYTTCIHYIHTDYKLTAYTNYAFQTRHKTHQMTTSVVGQLRSRLLLCRAPVAHTHISTFGIYSSHGSRENVGTYTHTHRQTDRPTAYRQTDDKPTDYHNPSLRMRARGLIMHAARACAVMGRISPVAEYPVPDTGTVRIGPRTIMYTHAHR